MKMFFFAIFALTSLAASAGDVFLKNTKLPRELQVKIEKAIQESCPRITDFFELQTEVSFDHIDQGQIDTYFKTTFQARWLFDGTHPTLEYITVESADLAIYNPAVDRFPVLKISSAACE